MSQEYDFSAVEKKWQKKWQEADAFRAPDEPSGNKNYVLDMFPYPSGDGLHVGHVESYTATDIYARFQRHLGCDVLHPMGWDAFGLPAENYAIKKGLPPQETTRKNIATFKRQIQSMGLSYDWSREVNTSDPSYYRWTQWLFLELHKKGLAYRKKAKANWCPDCQTVLANEQVVNGACERCGTRVVQKELEQWFFKVTKYADRLLNDLEKVDWPEAIKSMQRNWIGRSEGSELVFALKDSDDKIDIFTTRADTLMGATYVVLAPEHPLLNKIVAADYKRELEQYRQAASEKTVLQRAELEQEKTGFFTGAYALHPITNELLPIWVSDYVVMDYGSGAVMAVPAHDQRDFEFAKKFDLPVVEVISGGKDKNKAYEGKGELINSGEFNGLKSDDAKKVITEKAGGQAKVHFRLRDWLVSRQRYWGAPIPMIVCEKCGAVPVPEKDLPVTLPEDVDFRPKGESPLARSVSFHKNVKCPNCGSDARREADTMDTFVDSSWYFMRFTDPHNEKVPFAKGVAKKWLPVDIYIGGAEHAVLHLLYARFITKFLYDEGWLEFDEPFKKLRTQGMILGTDNQKMSKSRGNVINPDEIVDNYGADTLRLYEMFLGPLDQVKPWNTESIEGSFRFIKKTFKAFQDPRKFEGAGLGGETKLLIAKITQRTKELRYNTAIAAFMEHINGIQKGSISLSREDALAFTVLLAPYAPHLAEELWERLGGEGWVCQAKWPAVDAIAGTRESQHLPVQVNGKVRATVRVKQDMPEEDVVRAAAQAAARYVPSSSAVKKHIYVPGKIINLIVRS